MTFYKSVVYCLTLMSNLFIQKLILIRFHSRSVKMPIHSLGSNRVRLFHLPLWQHVAFHPRPTSVNMAPLDINLLPHVHFIQFLRQTCPLCLWGFLYRWVTLLYHTSTKVLLCRRLSINHGKYCAPPLQWRDDGLLFCWRLGGFRLSHRFCPYELSLFPLAGTNLLDNLLQLFCCLTLFVSIVVTRWVVNTYLFLLPPPFAIDFSIQLF